MSVRSRTCEEEEHELRSATHYVFQSSDQRVSIASDDLLHQVPPSVIEPNRVQ